MHIAVLDDDPAVLHAIDAMLSMAGYTVSAYRAGQKLLDVLFPGGIPYRDRENLPFDLLILNLSLKEPLRGTDVFLRVRDTWRADELPIIAITTADKATSAQVSSILPDDVILLRKPVALHVLLNHVSQLLGDRK
ncbi:MAG: response regulator transcription factor [Ktedonobacteraceae bacterium]|nr:response regulator transcription factor [Ktedonobacteraceae bacterium]